MMALKRLPALTLAIVGSLAFLPAVSWAGLKDYCITFTAPNPYLQVGRLFFIPPKGVCLPWIGFTPQNGLNSPSTGVGCTSSDDSQLTITMTTLEGGIYIFDSVTVALPGSSGVQTGTATEIQPDFNMGNSFTVDVSATKCSGETIPPGVTGTFTGVEALISSGIIGIGAAPTP
jgi:hypothetical protein